MTAYNVVRYRVKTGREKDFVTAHSAMAKQALKGFRRGALIKVGERAYCFIGEWDKFDSIVSARPQMIATLDTMRDILEDLGRGLGVTDPVSGEAVVELPGR
jgi:hypothetical protein